jgi:hypothetical protein
MCHDNIFDWPAADAPDPYHWRSWTQWRLHRHTVTRSETERQTKRQREAVRKIKEGTNRWEICSWIVITSEAYSGRGIPNVSHDRSDIIPATVHPLPAHNYNALSVSSRVEEAERRRLIVHYSSEYSPSDDSSQCPRAIIDRASPAGALEIIFSSKKSSKAPSLIGN